MKTIDPFVIPFPVWIQETVCKKANQTDLWTAIQSIRSIIQNAQSNIENTLKSQLNDVLNPLRVRVSLVSPILHRAVFHAIQSETGSLFIADLDPLFDIEEFLDQYNGTPYHTIYQCHVTGFPAYYDWNGKRYASSSYNLPSPLPPLNNDDFYNDMDGLQTAKIKLEKLNSLFPVENFSPDHQHEIEQLSFLIRREVEGQQRYTIT